MRCVASLVLLAAGAMAAASTVLLNASSVSSLLVDEDFENLDISKSGWQIDSESQGVKKGYYTIEGHQTAGGGCSGYAGLFQVKECGGDCYRAELKKHTNNFIEFGKEYWIGLSFMVPDDAGIKDKDDDVNIYHMQIHGDCSGAPNFGLQIHNSGPPFKHQFQWIGDDWETHKATLSGNVKMGSYEDFVLNVKFEKSKTGFFHLYRNGQKVLSKSGISTAYSDKKCSGKEPYLKIGAYVNKPFKNRDAKTKEWKVYYRAVKVAEGSSKLKDVDTRCHSPPTPVPTPPPPPTPTPPPSPLECSDSSAWLQDAYYAGDEIRALETYMVPSECCSACQAEAKCGSWTVAFIDKSDPTIGHCHLAAPGDGSIIRQVKSKHASGLKEQLAII